MSVAEMPPAQLEVAVRALLPIVPPEVAERAWRAMIASLAASIAGARPSALKGSVTDGGSDLAVAAQASSARPSPARRKPTAKARGKSRAARRVIPLEPSWGELRGRVRAAMTARELDVAGLAAELLIEARTLLPILSRNSPPSGPVTRRLEEWLEQREAPGVAAPAISFPRANGAARAGAA